ncbi:MAG: hypothetical protein IMF20_01850 [Proteobacteria bacterium]|nr:hypothetical protein [Pseudomonadota bacterium]
MEWNENPPGRPVSVSGLDQTFLQNVIYIIDAARRYGIRIYWCLLDGNDFLGDARTSRDALRRIFSLYRCRRSYIKNALLPFVQFLLDNDQGTTFAIDLVNEPDALWRSRFQRGWGRNSRIVINWLEEMASEIKGYLGRRGQDLTRILVSTGFCKHESITNYHDSLDHFDFFDFHAYNVLDVSDISGNLPSYSSLGINKPCIIGECGLGGQVERILAILGYSRFSGLLLRSIFSLQSQCIQNYFNNAWNGGHGGYAGCMVWEYGIKTHRTLVDTPRSLSSQAHWEDRYPLFWTNYRGQLCERSVVHVIQYFNP